MNARPKPASSWIVPLATMLGLACGLFLLPLPAEWSAGWRAGLLNRMHVPLIALCCVMLAAVFRKLGFSTTGSTGWAAAGALLLVVVMEMIQPWFRRTFSVEDMGWGAAGVVAGSGWNAAVGAHHAWTRTGIRLLALVCMTMPPAIWLAKVVAAKNAAGKLFPKLTGFPAGQERLFWSVESLNMTDSPHAGGDLILERDRHHSASARFDAEGRDWSAYGGLEIEGSVETPHMIDVGVRLDLEDGRTRLRTGARMAPGTQRVFIPWPGDTRPLKVRQLVVFLVTDAAVGRFRIHELRLRARSGPQS